MEREEVKVATEGTSDSQILSRIKKLHSVLVQYHESQSKSNVTFSNISKLHAEIQQDDKEDKKEPVKNPKLNDMYEIAKEETIREIDLIQNGLNLIQEIQVARYRKATGKDRGDKTREGLSKKQLMLAINEGGACLPLWIGRSNELPPPLCGAVPAEPGYIAPDGDLVAALIRVAEEETWILAEVLNFDPETNVYKIEDIAEKQKDTHFLEKDRIVILPKMRADPQENPTAIFPKEALVLALYPQTTCFYKALVYKPPTKAEEPYEVSFEDSTYETGYSLPRRVAQRYVLYCKDYNASNTQNTHSFSSTLHCMLKPSGYP